MVSSVVAGIGLLLAFVALASVRRLGRRLDQLSKSYWELRYDYTRLRSRLSRLDPEETSSEEARSAMPASQAAASPGVTFVPLSTMRKKAE